MVFHLALLMLAVTFARATIPPSPKETPVAMMFAEPAPTAAPPPASAPAPAAPEPEPLPPEPSAAAAPPEPQPPTRPAPTPAPVPLPVTPQKPRRSTTKPAAHQPPASAPQAAPAPPSPAATTPTEGAHANPVDGAWIHAIGAWLAAHKAYPDEARQRGEEGRLAVRFTIDRAGRVSAVDIVRSSGSPALDRAALAMLQDARLPPLPETMAQGTITVTVQIRYALAP